MNRFIGVACYLDEPHNRHVFFWYHKPKKSAYVREFLDWVEKHYRGKSFDIFTDEKRLGVGGVDEHIKT